MRETPHQKRGVLSHHTHRNIHFGVPHVFSPQYVAAFTLLAARVLKGFQVEPMIQSHPTEILTNEHRVIERVLRALESEVTTLEKPPFPRDFFDRALEFFATFADGCHHAKEERWLFPVLEKRGLTREGGPIGVMLYEHDQGRARLAEIRQNLDAAERGDRKAVEAVRRASESYVHLLRHHILKEDNVLFHMARMVLSAQDIEELGKQFHAIEQQSNGQGDEDRFLHLAEELSGAAAARC